MQTPDSQKIICRFFEALQVLIENKIIRGKQTFTRRYGINRWNMNTLEKNPESDIFQPAWLLYLTRDFMVSPRWLLTGEGNVFEYGWDAEKVKNVLKSVHV
ncbi:MAG: hypothetical protein NC548_36995 [Lachnospiraceae bacterium]|nr:hypothetical protein [Lachnospiraceae bacterium]